MGGVLKGRSGALHVVLLAGGGGTRFWPWSTRRRPKQFLDLTGQGPLIDLAWRRARRLVPASRIWAVAPKALVGALHRALPELPASNVIVEPAPRDTGPAIGLACATVARRDPAAVVAVFPTDHVVRDLPAFVAAVRVAEAQARRGSLVCLGVRPDRPATGFGYLRCATKPRRGRATAVAAFVEKPDLARARRFVASGSYLWNGGMFVWRAARLLDELGRRAPETLAAVAGTVAGRRKCWEAATRRSIDYAVMEKAEGVAVVPLDAGWDDVGSWEAAAKLRDAGGRAAGRHVLVDSPGTTVFDDEGTTAVVGIPGAVVVRSGRAVLVVARDRAEEVRKVVEALRERGERGLL
jgi:mannose-1-phosphate guanylyltransferase